MIIGTHSLIADNVEFSALRIAVVDEQHRFGVIQRGRFNSKVVCSQSLYPILAYPLSSIHLICIPHNILCFGNCLDG